MIAGQQRLALLNCRLSPRLRTGALRLHRRMLRYIVAADS